jgi:hypothetical protein
MDAKCKKEQMCTLFVWVGALKGGFGGWGSLKGDPPQKVNMPSKNKNEHPPAEKNLYSDHTGVIAQSNNLLLAFPSGYKIITSKIKLKHVRIFRNQKRSCSCRSDPSLARASPT